MNSPFVTVDASGPKVYDIVDSPIKRLLLAGDGETLTAVYMLDDDQGLPASEADAEHDPDSFGEVKAQLAAYFNGDLTEFRLRLAPTGSPFQLAVWSELTRIPYGTTTSYGDVALAIGKSLVASRAVGAANGQNPIPVIVPCHRVIGTDGSLTGFGGGLDRKIRLLDLEGAAPALW